MISRRTWLKYVLAALSAHGMPAPTRAAVHASVWSRVAALRTAKRRKR